MSAPNSEILAPWGMEGATIALHAHRENKVYRVERRGKKYALRQHRPGYRDDDQLRSELMWMAAAAADGLSVPTPVASARGQYLHHFGGHQIDLLEWLPGITLAEAMAAGTETRRDLMWSLGATAARFHAACDQWQVPSDFTRPAWDIAGLTGEAPVWGRFWENAALGPSDAALFAEFRDWAGQWLARNRASLDYGLIHADLLGENVLVEGDRLALIDFDDGGWGFRQFELATALIRHLDAPDYPDLRSSLFDGYHSVRPLQLDDFDVFLALRATTYVGWIADRPDLGDANERQIRNADLARDLIKECISARRASG